MKNYTHLDAHFFFVHHTGDHHTASAYIKWEGYLSTDTDLFQIHYFDDIWRYTEFVEENEIDHMGNVQYISKEEYTRALDDMMEDIHPDPMKPINDLLDNYDLS